MDTSIAQARAVSAPADPRHIALMIGVADYKNLPGSAPDGLAKLKAPVANDLPRMQHALEKWGFRPGPDMRVLRDSAASKHGIEAGFAWLAERVLDSSDVVVIYFAGHGSWAEDTNHDEAARDPDDRYDEALVPWDVGAKGIHDPKQLVLDDDIGRWLQALRTKNVTIIVDACFSGTITRGERETRLRGPAPPPRIAAERVQAVRLSGTSSISELDAQLGDPRFAIITAGTSGQRASERDFPTAGGAQPFGVLTYFLTEALDAAGDGTRYADLLAYVRQRVESLTEKLEQMPQLEGARSAVLFDVRIPTPAVPVLTVHNHIAGRYLLDAGAVHGVAMRTEYDVFPPGAKTFARATRIALLEVDSITRITAFAHAIGDAGATIADGSVALLAVVPPGAATRERILVHVPDSAAAIRASVAAIPFVKLSDAATADAVVTGHGGVYHVLVAGYEVRPPSLDSMIVAGRDTGFAPTTSALCPPLRRALAITALHQVDNPHAPFFRVDMRIDPVDRIPSAADDGTTVDTIYYHPTDSTKSPRYRVWMRAHAEQASTLYASVALAGFTASPWVLYAGNLVPRGWQQLYPVPGNVDLYTSWPTGADEFRVVVRDRPYDFTGLLTALPRCAGTRGPPEAKYREPAADFRGWTAFSHSVVTAELRP